MCFIPSSNLLYMTDNSFLFSGSVFLMYPAILSVPLTIFFMLSSSKIFSSAFFVILSIRVNASSSLSSSWLSFSLLRWDFYYPLFCLFGTWIIYYYLCWIDNHSHFLKFIHYRINIDNNMFSNQVAMHILHSFYAIALYWWIKQCKNYPNS